MSEATQAARRMTKYSPFSIQLPKPLSRLPVNLLWHGTMVRIDWIGFKADIDQDVPLERYWDVGDDPPVEYEPAEVAELLADRKSWKGGTHEHARAMFERDVFPRLEAVFADLLAQEAEEAGEASRPASPPPAGSAPSRLLDPSYKYDPVTSPTFIPEKEEVESHGLVQEKVGSAPANPARRAFGGHRKAKTPAG